MLTYSKHHGTVARMKKRASKVREVGGYTVFHPQKRTRLKPPEGRMSIPQKARIRTLMGSLTQADLASMLNVSPSHVSLLINGRRMPSVESAGRLAKILHVTVDDLLDTLAGR